MSSEGDTEGGEECGWAPRSPPALSLLDPGGAHCEVLRNRTPGCQAQPLDVPLWPEANLFILTNVIVYCANYTEQNLPLFVSLI